MKLQRRNLTLFHLLYCSCKRLSR